VGLRLAAVRFGLPVDSLPVRPRAGPAPRAGTESQFRRPGLAGRYPVHLPDGGWFPGRGPHPTTPPRPPTPPTWRPRFQRGAPGKRRAGAGATVAGGLGPTDHGGDLPSDCRQWANRDWQGPLPGHAVRHGRGHLLPDAAVHRTLCSLPAARLADGPDYLGAGA